MITTVVFDMGGVLADWNADQILQEMSIQEASKPLLKKEVFTAPEWVMVDAGFITEKEMEEAALKRLPQWAHDDCRFAIAHFIDYSLHPIQETLEIVRQLKKAGYELYLLSNASTRFSEYKDRFEAFTYMDGLFVSAFHHCYKPDQTMYRTFFDTYHLDPSQCLFIDDSQANIAASIMAGMDGILYRGDERELRQKLIERGIHIHE